MFEMSCPSAIAGKWIQIQVCISSITHYHTLSPQGEVPGPPHSHWVHHTSRLLPTAPEG